MIPSGKALQIASWPEEMRLIPRTMALAAEQDTEWQPVSVGSALSQFDRTSRADSWKVRSFAHEAGILQGIPLSRVQDQQLFQAIRRSIERGELVAVRQGGGAKKDATSIGATRRRIAREISDEARDRLFIDGRHFRMVAGDLWTGTGAESEFEVVGHEQAKAILGRLAVQPAASSRLKALLAQAAEQLSADWRCPARPNGLVLLRRRQVVRPVASHDMGSTSAAAKAPRKPPAFAITDLTIPPVFAPGAEEIEIAYVFEDPASIGESARLELFASGVADPVWSKAVPADHLTARRGSLKWDGKLDQSTRELPDGYATLEASPYRLKLTANAPGREETAERKTEVVLSDLQVALAPAECLKEHGPDWLVHRQIGVLPGDRSLNLDGNVFAMRLRTFQGEYSDELGELGLDLGHQAYADEWDAGAGPRIPLIATVRVRSSEGAPVVAGKALGRARILWDYAEPKMLPRGDVSDRDRKYLDGVAAFDDGGSRPIGGSNASAELGGKRAACALGRRAVFVAADSEVRDFPFLVESGRKRFWAGVGVLETDGPHEGQSGVVFRPSVIAGDAFSVRAYLDVSRVLDDDLDIPDDVPSVKVGTFVVWRQIKLSRRVRKCEEVPDFVPDPRPYLEPAFVALDDQLQSNAFVMTKPEYDSAFQRAVRIVRAQRSRGKSVDPIALYSLPTGVSQYDHADSTIGRLVDSVTAALGGTPTPTPWVATFRPWDDFVATFAATLGQSEDVAARKLGRQEIFASNYPKKTESLAIDIAVEMALPMARKRGIAVVQFDYIHALNYRLGRRGGGVAVFSDTDRHRSAVALFGGTSSTFAHEIGHCLFLPHAPSDPHEDIDRVVSGRHVAAATDCNMAYGARGGFCAICLLRLRGCDGSFLKPGGMKLD